MAEPSTTVAVIPRETFSQTMDVLGTIVANTAPPYRLLVVDGGSPARVRRSLESFAASRDATLLRTERLLSPNEARNLALAHVDTELVAFVDTNAFVHPGWLDALERCARETGAWLVGPLYLGVCRGNGPCDTVHMAGGDNRIDEVDGRRLHHERHRYAGRPLAEVGPFERGPTEMVEFHTVLARTDVFSTLGPLDEALLSFHEHCDLCLAVRERGGEVWFEPEAVVTYQLPRTLAPMDLPYWLVRWSDQWNLASARHFVDKWQLSDGGDSIADVTRFATNHRLFAYRPYLSPWVRLVRRAGREPRPLVDRWAQAVAHRAARRRDATPARVVHAASWSRVGAGD